MLTLVNLFRLLVAVLLTVMFLTITPTRVGQAYPGLFVGATAAYFAYALLSIATVKRRWPDVSMQTIAGLCIDVLAIAAADLRERRHDQRPRLAAGAADRRAWLRRAASAWR